MKKISQCLSIGLPGFLLICTSLLSCRSKEDRLRSLYQEYKTTLNNAVHFAGRHETITIDEAPVVSIDQPGTTTDSLLNILSALGKGTTATVYKHRNELRISLTLDVQPFSGASCSLMYFDTCNPRENYLARNSETSRMSVALLDEHWIAFIEKPNIGSW